MIVISPAGGDGDVMSVGTIEVLFPPLIASVGTITRGNEKPAEHLPATQRDA